MRVFFDTGRLKILIFRVRPLGWGNDHCGLRSCGDSHRIGVEAMDAARRKRIERILDDHLKWVEENPQEARQWMIDKGFILENGDLPPKYRSE